MKNSVRAALAAVVLVLSSLTLQTPASAATAKQYTGSCKKGGFTGHVRVTYTNGNTTAKRIVHRVEYKINKGDNRGGNNANVYWNDYGTIPNPNASTTTGKQDNKWHVLREANYTRPGGGTEMKFIFDKSLASDPTCSVYDVI